MPKTRLRLAEVCRLIEPGPVLLMTTARRGRANVMALSWHTMLEFEPPLIGCVVSDRDHSFAALRATRQCVLNLSDAGLARAVVGCGNVSGRSVDKFRRFGLTAVPASRVAAPLIDECMAALGCQVVDTRFVNRYGFFVLEVVAARVDRARREAPTLHHRGRGRFMVGGATIRLSSRAR